MQDGVQDEGWKPLREDPSRMEAASGLNNPFTAMTPNPVTLVVIVRETTDGYCNVLWSWPRPGNASKGYRASLVDFRLSLTEPVGALRVGVVSCS